jgi:zinc protease
MKTNLKLLIATLALSTLTTAQSRPAAKAPAKPSGAVASTIKQIPIKPLPEFKPQQPKRIELANGMVIFLQEDHELPFISGSAIIRGGEREVPAAKVGLVDIYQEVWRTGGTKSRTGDQLDDFLESRAASVEAGGGVASTSLNFSSLKNDFDDVFKVFLEVLREPAFRENKIALAKDQMKGAISRRNDDVGDIAGREANRLGYGTDNPYARQAEYWTVAAVNQQDLIDFHAKRVHPNNIIFGVTGDFDSAQMEAKLRQAFESWQKGPSAEKIDVQFKDPKPGVYFIPKDDVNQSSIYLVALGTDRKNPDYYALTVMNELFGGGFSSRLFNAIRTKQGLAYGVGGGVGFAYDHPGLFTISTSTKSQTTLQATEALFKEVDRLLKEPPTAEEVQRAKDSILNSFVFRFDSKGKVLNEKMIYEFYGYPADFLEKYQSAIQKITPADVERVAKKYVDAKKFATLIVGKEADFDKPVSSLGPVQKIDITINDEPPTAGGAPAAAASPAQSNPEGKALIAKVLAAAGGKEKIAALKTIQTTATDLRATPQGDFPIDTTRVVELPNRMKATLSTPMGEMVMVATPEAAFMASPQGSQDLPGNVKEEAMKDFKRGIFNVLQHTEDPAYAFTANGMEKIGEINAAILDISADGATTRWYIDPATSLPIRATYKAVGQQGPVQRVIDFSDYRDVNGYKFAFKSVTKENGQQMNASDVKDIKINVPVDAKTFAKP